MPSFAQMMGILDTGGKQLSQAFQQNKDNALRQRQQEEDEKKNAAMLKLTGVQTETAQQGLATEKDKAQAQKDFLAQSEAELAALEKDPTVDPKILAKAKENLKLQRMVSYFNPDKVGDFSINKNDLAQNEEMIGNKLAMAKEELSGKQAETGLRTAQTAQVKKETSLLGMPKPDEQSNWKEVQTGTGIALLNTKTGELKDTDLKPKLSSVSQKTQMIAKGNFAKMELAEQQLNRIAELYEKNSGAFSTGILGGHNVLSSSGMELQKAIDNYKQTARTIQRTPGEGAMSDMETRLSQAGLPKRTDMEAPFLEALQEHRDMIKTMKQGYGYLVPDYETEDKKGGGSTSDDDLLNAHFGGSKSQSGKSFTPSWGKK